jgi:hypothetical protein
MAGQAAMSNVLELSQRQSPVVHDLHQWDPDLLEFGDSWDRLMWLIVARDDPQLIAAANDFHLAVRRCIARAGGI